MEHNTIKKTSYYYYYFYYNNNTTTNYYFCILHTPYTATPRSRPTPGYNLGVSSCWANHPFQNMRREVFVAFLCLAWRALACPDGQVQVTVAWDQGTYASRNPVGNPAVWGGGHLWPTRRRNENCVPSGGGSHSQGEGYLWRQLERLSTAPRWVRRHGLPGSLERAFQQRWKKRSANVVFTWVFSWNVWDELHGFLPGREIYQTSGPSMHL